MKRLSYAQWLPEHVPLPDHLKQRGYEGPYTLCLFDPAKGQKQFFRVLLVKEDIIGVKDMEAPQITAIPCDWIEQQLNKEPNER